MKTSTIVRPVNSLIFISDVAGWLVPPWEKDKLILSTKSCISVGCYPEQDGPTKVMLGAAHEVDPGFQPAFAGPLDTPNHSVTVWTVTHQIILQMSVAAVMTNVSIWLNDPRWPNEVTIGLV
jgi:hypothetical protein